MSDTRFYVSPNDATRFAYEILIKSGLNQEDATVMARCLVLSDVRGVDTHGLAKLPQYLERASKGMVKIAPNIKVVHKTPVCAQLDGDNGFGFVVATKGMDVAIEAAKIYGIGICAVINSNHFGMAATYVLQAIEQDMIALVFTNSAKQMPPFGGREPLLGISPFAAGAPSGNEVPYLLDMAPSVVAKGKIRKAQRRGESIPLGWALDNEGRPTTDANAAMEGSMTPIGGPKGSGIAILMDVFSGVLTVAEFAGNVGDQYKHWDRAQNVGHTFIAIKPEVFMSIDDFKGRMDHLVKTVHSAPTSEGFKEVLFPGEPEFRLQKSRESQGIPYAQAERTLLETAAKEYDVKSFTFHDSPDRKSVV